MSAVAVVPSSGPSTATAATTTHSAVVAAGLATMQELDDWSSAWEDVVADGSKWGGRGKGGRYMGTTHCVSRALCVALSRVVAAWGAWASRWRFGAPLQTGRVTQLHTGKDVILGT